MSEQQIDLKIATPERVVFRAKEIDRITLPTLKGEITVLPNHVPLIAVLAPGEIIIHEKNQAQSLSVSGGFIEVLSDKVVVLADTAERAEELDIERAEAARQRAAEAMAQKKFDAKEFAALSAKIEKEMARLRVAKKYRYQLGKKGAEVKNYNE